MKKPFVVVLNKAEHMNTYGLFNGKLESQNGNLILTNAVKVGEFPGDHSISHLEVPIRELASANR